MISAKQHQVDMALQLRYRCHSVSEDDLMNHSGSSHRFTSVAEGRASFFYTTFGHNFCISFCFSSVPNYPGSFGLLGVDVMLVQSVPVCRARRVRARSARDVRRCHCWTNLRRVAQRRFAVSFFDLPGLPVYPLKAKCQRIQRYLWSFSILLHTIS